MTHDIPQSVLRVRYQHQREIRSNADGATELLAKGGQTICLLMGDDEKILAMGTAHCSKHDNYNKRIGRDISLGRALKDLRQAESEELPHLH